MSALKNKDTCQSITQRFLEMSFPNKGNHIQTWFCCGSATRESMDEKTFMNLGK